MSDDAPGVVPANETLLRSIALGSDNVSTVTGRGAVVGTFDIVIQRAGQQHAPRARPAGDAAAVSAEKIDLSLAVLPTYRSARSPHVRSLR